MEQIDFGKSMAGEIVERLRPARALIKAMQLAYQTHSFSIAIAVRVFLDACGTLDYHFFINL